MLKAPHGPNGDSLSSEEGRLEMVERGSLDLVLLQHGSTLEFVALF